MPEISKDEDIDNYNSDREKIQEFYTSKLDELNLNIPEMDNTLDKIFEVIDLADLIFEEKESNEIDTNNITDEIPQDNWIEGILDIKLYDYKDIIVLFQTEIDYLIDVVINNQKVKIKKLGNNWIIKNNFEYKGKIQFKIVFYEKVTDCKDLFKDCKEIIFLDLSNFDTSNASNMSGMFEGCSKLKEIKGLNKIITNKVKNMHGMFDECRELEYLDLSNFDTSNVNDMIVMFNDCIKLKEIKGLNKFNTCKVEVMTGMFQFCYCLTNLDLSNFNTSNTIKTDYMFNRCNRLTEIKGIEKFITNKVITMISMFQDCHELNYLNISNFDTSNVEDMSRLFN